MLSIGKMKAAMSLPCSTTEAPVFEPLHVNPGSRAVPAPGELRAYGEAWAAREAPTLVTGFKKKPSTGIAVETSLFLNQTRLVTKRNGSSFFCGVPAT